SDLGRRRSPGKLCRTPEAARLLLLACLSSSSLLSRDARHSSSVATPGRFILLLLPEHQSLPYTARRPLQGMVRWEATAQSQSPNGVTSNAVSIVTGGGAHTLPAWPSRLKSYGRVSSNG